jgi:hypothetical protein
VVEYARASDVEWWRSEDLEITIDDMQETRTICPVQDGGARATIRFSIVAYVTSPFRESFLLPQLGSAPLWLRFEGMHQDKKVKFVQSNLLGLQIQRWCSLCGDPAKFKTIEQLSSYTHSAFLSAFLIAVMPKASQLLRFDFLLIKLNSSEAVKELLCRSISFHIINRWLIWFQPASQTNIRLSVCGNRAARSCSRFGASPLLNKHPYSALFVAPSRSSLVFTTPPKPC